MNRPGAIFGAVIEAATGPTIETDPRAGNSGAATTIAGRRFKRIPVPVHPVQVTDNVQNENGARVHRVQGADGVQTGVHVRRLSVLDRRSAVTPIRSSAPAPNP